MSPLGLCTQAQKIAGRGTYRPYSQFFRTYLSWKNSPATPMYSLSKTWANLSLLARVCIWKEYERRWPNGLEGTDNTGQPCVQYPACPRPALILLAAEGLAPCRLGHRDSSCWESLDSLFLVVPEEFGEFLAIPFFSRLRRLHDL